MNWNIKKKQETYLDKHTITSAQIYPSFFDCDSPQLFAVISWGCAATHWLSKALNSHPEIFCLHNANNKWYSSDITKPEKKIDGVKYFQIMSKLGDVYQGVGDVHGVSRYLVPELRDMLGNKFNAVVVVREPISRLKSMISLFNNAKEPYDVYYVNDLIKNKHITLPKYDYEHKLFVHGVNMLNAIIDEVKVGKIFRSEDLTTNPEILEEFIKEITNGKISTSKELILQMLSIERVSKHNKQEIQFKDWQIEIIQKVVDENAWKLYSELGYDKPKFL